MVTTDFVQFPAHHGIRLNGLLLRPHNAQASVRIVIEVYGVSAAHVKWGYRHFQQFLANRSYAAQALNYSGFDGYGRAFQKTGFGKYSKKCRLIGWHSDFGYGSKNSQFLCNCDHQGSYAGYASAMALAREPNIFKAAIIENAMRDMEKQSKFPSYY